MSRCQQPVFAQRFAAQQLTGPPAAGPVAVARRLLAVQAQDARGARLAIRARTAGLTAAAVDHELTVTRSLVVSWLNRSTLHLVAAEDYWWLHALTTPPLFTGNARRLAQEGVPRQDAERAVAVVERALATDGPLTRGQLRDRIAAAGVRTEGQALVHILALASLRGLIVRGPVAAGEQAFVLARDWLGAPPGPLDRDRALAGLARRYLAGHGPATDRDLAKWAGLPLRDARRGLAGIAGELASRADGMAALASQEPGCGLPPPRLLGAFDPVLLGWSSRAGIVDPSGPVVTSNGLFRPFVLVEGRAAGLWSIRGGEVVLSPSRPLTGQQRAALAAESDDVLRYLGLSTRAAASSGS